MQNKYMHSNVVVCMYDYSCTYVTLPEYHTVRSTL